MHRQKEHDLEYQKVIKILKEVYDDGLIFNGSGHCVAMSDILYKLLIHNGIDCDLVEVSLMITKQQFTDVVLLGYSMCNRHDKQTEVNTHVVCVTRGKKPILIDASVYGLIEGVPYVCEYVDLNQPITKIVFENGKFHYTQKYTDFKLPEMHQRSILDRIKTDDKIFKSIARINKVVIIALTISTLNFIRGLYDHYEKYIVKDNGFGPNEVPHEVIKK